MLLGLEKCDESFYVTASENKRDYSTTTTSDAGTASSSSSLEIVGPTRLVSVNEGGAVVLLGITSSLSTPDASETMVLLDLSVTPSGGLSFGGEDSHSTDGLKFEINDTALPPMEAGRDVASISLSVRGSMDALNAALAGLTYRSTLGYHGLIVVNVTMVSNFKAKESVHREWNCRRASRIWKAL